MDQIGKVIKINGSIAEIQIQRATACGGDCGKCSGCVSTTVSVSAKNEVYAKVGQMVELSSSTRNILAVAFMVYIIPLIIFIIGYIATYSYIISNTLSTDTEIIPFFVGLCSLILSFFILRIVDKRLQKSDKLEMKITKVIN